VTEVVGSAERVAGHVAVRGEGALARGESQVLPCGRHGRVCLGVRVAEYVAAEE
jgi:hypothetical protein